MMGAISAEEVAARHGKRPGYKLLTYREVGLPFWEVPLLCRLLARKPMLAVEEFVLRSVEAGLGESSDISGLLGLPIRVVDTVMGKLVSSGHLIPRVSSAGISYVLSEQGAAAALEHSQIVPENRVIELAFDGLLHRYVTVDSSLRWRPRDLRDHEILEVPAFPADPPGVGPGDTPAVASAIKELLHDADLQLLNVLGVEGRRSKFFVRGVVLIFQSLDRADDIAVQFAVDGRLVEEYDHAFAKAEGLRKLGILESLRHSDTVGSNLLGGEVLEQVADESEVAALRRVSDGLREELSDLEHLIEVTSDDRKDALAAQAEAVTKKLDRAETALSRVPVRILEVHEHRALLLEALTSAEERLMIISPWIRDAVIDAEFVSSIEALLLSGVAVYIGYGIGEEGSRRGDDRGAESKLIELSLKYEGFTFVRLGDTHAKVLIVDRRFVVVTSFNWLSFRGDPARPFRDERGTFVTLDNEIDRIFDGYEAKMKAKMAANPA